MPIKTYDHFTTDGRLIKVTVPPRDEDVPVCMSCGEEIWDGDFDVCEECV